MQRRRTCAILVGLVVAAPAAMAQGEPAPGGFGFAIEVDGEGFFLNPTLKSVTIKSVAPGRPAAIAGIQPGDRVVEVQGKQVAGAKGRDLEPLMKKHVGETLALRLRRPNGDTYYVSLVATARQN